MGTFVTPAIVESLVAEGRWPATEAEQRAQNLKGLVPAERIAVLAPDETELCLDAPPFVRVLERAEHNPFWNWPSSDPAGLDFEHAYVIGDFGLGSDAPIVLDYREVGDGGPRVMRLWWSPDGPDHNAWVVMAPDLATFVSVLGL